jgi:predicted CopG family antitoxin
MSKNISISEDVYELLKREKGDKSFSELIEEKVNEGNRIEEAAGLNVLDEETYQEVKDDVGELSQRTDQRLR